MQIIGGPLGRSIQMAEVASIGAAYLRRSASIRAVDVVVADRFEQAVSGVRHVTVKAKTACRSGSVVSMCLDVAPISLVALEAGFIAVHPPTKLVNRIAVVHLVTREAG